MNFHILTLFPEMVMGGLNTSITGRAIDKGLISVEAVNIRDYSKDKHHHVDDAPYGGGAGMVMQPEPIYDAYEALAARTGKRPRVIYLTPQGQVFNQKIAEELAKEEDLVFLCGHYEGIDERALERKRFDAVGHGVQVRHGGNVSEAAVRGGQCAGADGFLIRKSRLTKMNMNINETGKQNHIRNINNNSIIGRGNTITNRNDLSVRKKHVRQMKHALREKLCILQKIAHFHFLLVLFSVHYTG